MDGAMKIHKVKRWWCNCLHIQASGVSVSCELTSTNNHINTEYSHAILCKEENAANSTN
jgi:hypothetical protein